MIAATKRWLSRRLGLDRVARTADRAADATADLQAARADDAARATRLEQQLADLRDELAAARTAEDVLLGTAWAATAPLPAHPTISVVMATRDRAGLVLDAIGSVVDQTYSEWELLVVDDGSADDTAALLDRVAATDGRIRIGAAEGVGAGAARNVGLSMATGDIVAFLDDDNAMCPGWLRAVAEHFGRNGEHDVVFGAQLREEPTGPSRLLFTPDATLDQVRLHNSIDLGVLAVRRGHPELRFDEELDRYIDWELVVRLMEHSALHPIPVLAGVYTTRADRRISAGGDDERLVEMQRRFAERSRDLSG